MKTTLLLIALGATGCGSSSAPQKIAFPGSPLLTADSQSGHLHIEVRTSPQPPSRGNIAGQFVITDDGGKAVDGLVLDITPWMPQHGHGSSAKPTVTAQGSGGYLVENLYLAMAGDWQLRTDIAGATHDHAEPILTIP